MSTQVANVNLSGFVVGQSSNIPFGAALTPPTIHQQMRPSASVAANLFVFNESGCGLRMTFPVSGESLTLAAGQWRIISIPPNETQLNFTVLYVLPNAPVTKLLADLYLPGETVDAIGVLGNSPIGLSAVSLPVTQVIQDGQPAGQTIVESTPTGDPQTILWTTDGLLRIRPQGGSNALQLTSPNATEQVNIGCINGAGFFAFDNIGGNFIFQGATSTSINFAVPFTQVGGQNTTGSLGVPVIVAQALGVSVVTTALTAILTYAVTTTGFYRVSAFFTANNATSPQQIFLNVGYTDPDSGLAATSIFVTNDNNTPQVLGGVSIAVANLPYSTVPVFVHAKTGTNLTVNYRDNGGTPSDKVSAIVERMA